VLGDDGLVAAIRVAVGTSAVPVEVVAHEVGRYASAIEAAAYFTCLEAVQNAAKHAAGTRIRVELRGDAGSVSLYVEDDGAGFDVGSTPVGSGMANMRDRVESVDGTLTTYSTPTGGTRIEVRLPTAYDGLALAERGA
jgi:signal transduction histidine kinase